MILLLAASLRCLAVTGASITAADAARAMPGLDTGDPDRILGASPLPGIRRTFEPAELDRLLPGAGPFPPLCFEYATKPPSPAAMLDSLRKALSARYPESRAWQVHLIDHSDQRVPDGDMRFLISSITPNRPAGTVLIRGSIGYAGSRTHPVWVHVRIEARHRRLFAARTLKRGSPLTPEDVEEREVAEPAPGRPSPPLAAVIGLAPSRDVPSGGAIEADLLGKAPEVAQGDLITVEVTSGPARLTFEGRAEAAGRRGGRIPVVNPATGKRLIALVTGPRKALLALDSGPGARRNH